MKKYIGLTAFLFSMVFLSEAQTTNLGIMSGTGGTTNVYIGSNSGKVSTSQYNTFLGHSSGFKNTTGGYNLFLGYRAGYSNLTGEFNVITGSNCGYSLTSGNRNSFMGYFSGYATTIGYQNVFIGNRSGRYLVGGYNNVFVGNDAGLNNVSGFGNVFLGNAAGINELGSNKLIIDNANTPTPLIWGDFNTDRLVFNGKVSIGSTTFPLTVGGVNIAPYQLYVKGGILTEEVRVRSGWADYVFNDDYNLIPISELNNYISKNKHLPGFPSANDVENNGLSLGEIAKIQQEKIEELTLYLIQQNAQIEDLKIRLNKIEAENVK